MADNDDIACALVARSEQLDNDDATWRAHMGDIAELIRPLRTELSGTTTSEGAKRMTKVFDGTAINACGKLAAGLFGSASNPAEEWFTLSLEDKDLAKWGPNRDWLARQARKLLLSCGPGYSSFYAQVPSLYLDLAAFGTGIFSSELKEDHSGFIDMTRPLSTHNFDVDSEGNANTMFVQRTLSVENAAREFGKENLSPTLQAKLGGKTKVEAKFLRAVCPNDGFTAGILGPKGKPVASYTIELETKNIVKREGFWDFPYFVPRWEVAAGERKGRGQGAHALPDTRSLNVMVKANLKAGERSADPSWGAPDEGQISVVRLGPGKVTYGAIDRNGNQLLKPLMEGGEAPFSLEMANQLRSAIKDYFYYSLMDLEGRTGMTTVETIERTEEMQRLMAPYLGRINTDFLSPFVLRRWRLLQNVPGFYARDPAPPDLEAHIGKLKVDFVSSAALAQRSARGAGVARFYAVAKEIFEIDPMAAAKVSSDKSLETLADAFAVPQIINDDDTTATNRAAIQKQMAAQAAQPMADAAHKGAQAIQIMRGGAPAAA